MRKYQTNEEMLDKCGKTWQMGKYLKYEVITDRWVKYLTTSTAPPLTFGSFPDIDTLAVNEPSILNTTASVLGGSTARKKSAKVWSPLQNKQ